MRNRWILVPAALAVGAVAGYHVGAASSRPTVAPPAPSAERAEPPRRPALTLRLGDAELSEGQILSGARLHDWCGTPSASPYGLGSR